jgi:hypothetical protein
MDPGVGGASARHQSPAAVRRKHLPSGAEHPRLLGSPDRAIAHGRAAGLARRLARARAQHRLDRRVCAHRMDGRPGRSALDRQPSCWRAERIAPGIQRVLADTAAADSGSPFRVLPAGAAGARPCAPHRTAARRARPCGLVRVAVADRHLSHGVHGDFDRRRDAGQAARRSARGSSWLRRCSGSPGSWRLSR